jgi:hypothetical protein
MSKHMTRNTNRRPLVISWDNPVPADSKRMIRHLKRHGRVRRTEPKTTVSLVPYGRRIDWRKIRRTIVRNLNPSRGNAMYANLNSGRAFEYGRSTNYKWRQVS